MHMERKEMNLIICQQSNKGKTYLKWLYNIFISGIYFKDKEELQRNLKFYSGTIQVQWNKSRGNYAEVIRNQIYSIIKMRYRYTIKVKKKNLEALT